MPRGLNREIDVRRIGVGDLGERLLGARADGREIASGLRRAPLAADEELIAGWDVDPIGRLG